MALWGALTHRKIRRLASTLKIYPCYALGILEALWHVTAKQSPRGDIGRMSNQDICDEIYYGGNPEKLISALIEARLVDLCEENRLVIHDWENHADQSIKRRLARNNQSFCKAMTSHDDTSIVMNSIASGIYSGSGSGSGKGGLGGKENGKGKGSLESLMVYSKEIGLMESDGDWFFYKSEGNGWTNNGKPIIDWKATMRSWKTQGYFPSQKQGKPKETSEEQAERIIRRMSK